MGPYFNGLKRNSKALKRIDRCGRLYGDVAIMTADTFCAWRKSKKGWFEGASLPVGVFWV